MKYEVRYGRVSTIDYEAGTCEVTYKDRDESVTKKVSFISNRKYVMPKVGDMLIVLHPGAQPEDAIVLGTIWNEKNKPTGGGEGIYREDYNLEAGKCFFLYDANEPASKFYVDGNDSVQVTGDRKTSVEGNRENGTDGNLSNTVKGDSKTDVGGSATATVSGDNSLTVSGNDAKTVSGNVEITVNGKLTVKVGGCTVTIDGSSVTINAASELSVSAPTVKLDGTTVQINGSSVNITGGAGDCTIMGKSLVNHMHTSTAPGSLTSTPV